MTWRLAGALVTYEAAARTQRPGITLGDIRDPAGGSESDHNPWVKDSKGVGVVRAVDNMVYGATAAGQVLANNLAAKLNKHPAMGHGAYVIWQQHIISADRLSEGWRAMEDRGSPTANHMDHVHLSICLAEGGYDYRGSWGALFSGSGTGAAPTPGSPEPGTLSTAPQAVTHTKATVVPINRAGNGSGASGGSGGGDFSNHWGGTKSSGDGSGLGADGVESLVVYGAALGLGAVLLGLGAIALTKPARDAFQDQADDAAGAIVKTGALL